MSISEMQLETWSKVGAVVSSRDTYATIKDALDAPDAAYAGKKCSVFLQGSYGNDTNVYAESDVDIVIVLNNVYFHGISALSDTDKANFRRAWVAAGYGYAAFKRDVLALLTKKFGKDVVAGDKAIQIAASGSRRKADVIVAVEYREYTSHNDVAGINYISGIAFRDAANNLIANYPKRHSDNLTMKHQATGGWLKPTIRIFKNIRNRMVEEGKIEAGLAPSYYLEGLLYNVPAGHFGRNYVDTFINSFNYLAQTDRSKFVCANEQYFLLFENSPVTWRADKCSKFLTAAANYWTNW